MRWRKQSAMVALLMLVWIPAGRGAETSVVDLALVLAVDASASITGGVLDFQLRGHAAAFRDPQVADAISAGPHGAIAATLVQWAGPHTLETLVPWKRVANADDAANFAQAIIERPRPLRDGSTAIGSAIDDAHRLFENSGFDATRKILDLSSNGFSNSGLEVARARDRAIAADITINALVILDEYDWLVAYFEESVIGGPGAFVHTAEDGASFAEALLRKLIKEIAALPEAR
jgi:Ca-activated chloride channel homolog